MKLLDMVFLIDIFPLPSMESETRRAGKTAVMRAPALPVLHCCSVILVGCMLPQPTLYSCHEYQPDAALSLPVLQEARGILRCDCTAHIFAGKYSPYQRRDHCGSAPIMLLQKTAREVTALSPRSSLHSSLPP
jgi:hypothetical protein